MKTILKEDYVTYYPSASSHQITIPKGTELERVKHSKIVLSYNPNVKPWWAVSRHILYALGCNDHDVAHYYCFVPNELTREIEE